VSFLKRNLNDFVDVFTAYIDSDQTDVPNGYYNLLLMGGGKRRKVPVLPDSMNNNYVEGDAVLVGRLNRNDQTPFIIGYASNISKYTVPEEPSTGGRLLPLQNFYGNMGMTRWLPGATKDITPLGFSSEVAYLFSAGEIPGLSDEGFMYTNKRRYSFTDNGSVLDIHEDVATPNIEASGKYPVFDQLFYGPVCVHTCPILFYRTPFVDDGKVYWAEYDPISGISDYYELNYSRDTAINVFTADPSDTPVGKTLSLGGQYNAGQWIRTFLATPCSSADSDGPYSICHYSPDNSPGTKMQLSTFPSKRYSVFSQYITYTGNIFSLNFGTSDYYRWCDPTPPVVYYPHFHDEYNSLWKYYDTSVQRTFSWNGTVDYFSTIRSPFVKLWYEWEYFGLKNGVYDYYFEDFDSVGSGKSDYPYSVTSHVGVNQDGLGPYNCHSILPNQQSYIFIHSKVYETSNGLITKLSLGSFYFVSYGWDGNYVYDLHKVDINPSSESNYCFLNNDGEIISNDSHIRMNGFDMPNFFGNDSIWWSNGKYAIGSEPKDWIDWPAPPPDISHVSAHSLVSYVAGGRYTRNACSNDTYMVLFDETTRMKWVVLDKEFNNVYEGEITNSLWPPVWFYSFGDDNGTGFITDDNYYYTTFFGWYDAPINKYIKGIIGIDLMTSTMIYWYIYIWDYNQFVANGYDPADIEDYQNYIFFYGGYIAICIWNAYQHPTNWRWILIKAKDS